MPKYELYYFDFRGRGEHIRQIFVLAGVKFEDKRIDYNNEWPQYKKDMPFGQVPVLDVDGVKLCQSVAIARFLGRKFNLAGKDDITNAKLDMLADIVTDAINADGAKQWPSVLIGAVQIDKTQYFKDKVWPAVEPYLSHIEKQLLDNRNGLLLGEKETWVDIYAAEFCSKLKDYGQKDLLDAFPHIQEFVQRIHSIPAIRNYLQARKPSVL